MHAGEECNWRCLLQGPSIIPFRELLETVEQLFPMNISEMLVHI